MMLIAVAFALPTPEEVEPEPAEDSTDMDEIEKMFNTMFTNPFVGWSNFCPKSRQCDDPNIQHFLADNEPTIFF